MFTLEGTGQIESTVKNRRHVDKNFPNGVYHTKSIFVNDIVRFWRFLFHWLQPKNIFILCYYFIKIFIESSREHREYFSVIVIHFNILRHQNSFRQGTNTMVCLLELRVSSFWFLGPPSGHWLEYVYRLLSLF